jgi:hypothetical protein
MELTWRTAFVSHREQCNSITVNNLLILFRCRYLVTTYTKINCDEDETQERVELIVYSELVFGDEATDSLGSWPNLITITLWSVVNTTGWRGHNLALRTAIQSSSWPQWPCGLRHELSSLTRTLGPWVRIQLKAWMCVCIYSMFVSSLCVGSAPETGWSPIQGVPPIVYGITKLKKKAKVQRTLEPEIDR